MPKKSYIQILLILGMTLTLLLAGCVDTSVQPIPSSFNFRSEVSLVNFAEGVNSAEFTMSSANGETVSFNTVAYGEASSSFLDVPAGSKTLMFNSESYKFNTEIDKKIRLFVVGTSADRKVVKFTQRYTFQTKSDPTSSSLYPEGMAGLAFFNGSSDAVVTKVHAVSADVDTMIAYASPLETGDFSNYKYLKAGTFTIDVIADNGLAEDTVITSFQTQGLSSKGKYTAAIYDVKTNLKNKVLTDD